MSRALLAPWSANLAAVATLSALYGAVDDEFPLENLVDGDPANACRFTTPYGLILLTFSEAVHLAIVALIHHNMDEALNIELRAYSSEPVDESTPADLTVPLTIGEPEADGFRNAWFDVDAEDEDASYQYWAVAIVSDENEDDLSFGELWAVDEPIEIPNGIGISGTQLADGGETIVNRTYGGTKLKATKRSREESFVLTVAASEAEIQTLVDFLRVLGGRAQNALLIPDRDKQGVHMVDSADEGLQRTPFTGGDYAAALRLVALSRGLAWP